jgi:hypothetical protein
MILPNPTAQSQKLHDEQISKVLSNISLGSTVVTTFPAPGGANRINDADSNMEGDKLAITSPVAPNTEFAVNHSLGRVPSGFIYLGGTNQGHVYRGVTAWTKTQIFLKETQGSNGFVIQLV